MSVRLSVLLLALVFIFAGCSPQDRGPQRPNVLLIVADDLGHTDVGAYNDDTFNDDTFYETPHIDSLARRGMMFTDGSAANPVCSPPRSVRHSRTRERCSILVQHSPFNT